MNMRYIACVWSCISAPSGLRTSIPLRYISVAGLRFGSVRAACSASPHLDSASLHLGRGQSAYVIHNAPPNSCEHDCAHRYVCRTFIFAVLRTSIPLRYISVAGLRPMIPYKKAGWKASFPHAFLYGIARLEAYTQKKHKLILFFIICGDADFKRIVYACLPVTHYRVFIFLQQYKHKNPAQSTRNSALIWVKKTVQVF